MSHTPNNKLSDSLPMQHKKIPIFLCFLLFFGTAHQNFWEDWDVGKRRKKESSKFSLWLLKTHAFTDFSMIIEKWKFLWSNPNKFSVNSQSDNTYNSSCKAQETNNAGTQYITTNRSLTHTHFQSLTFIRAFLYSERHISEQNSRLPELVGNTYFNCVFTSEHQVHVRGFLGGRPGPWWEMKKLSCEYNMACSI